MTTEDAAKPSGLDKQLAYSEAADDRNYPVRDWEAERRASEMVNSGLHAWEQGDLETAERQLRAGLDAYRVVDEFSINYALGRLGAFLVEQDRLDEAAHVLEEALQNGTTISAVFGSYRILIRQRKERGEWGAEQSEGAEAALRAGFRTAERRGPPHQAVAFDALARFLLEEDRPEDAEREIQAALAIVPDDVNLLRSLWRALHLKRDASGVVEVMTHEFRVRNHRQAGGPSSAGSLT